MPILIVVNNPNDWTLEIPGVELVSSRAYLTDPKYSDLRGVKVFNLCRSYRYQTFGYYVSLLAAARGHKPLPNVATIQDMKSMTIVRFASDDLDQLIQHSLASIHSDKFVLSIYFGRNMAKKYEKLSQQLFNQFKAPLLRAHFVRSAAKWQLQSVGPVSVSELPEDHHDFLVGVAKEYFSGRRISVPRKSVPRYHLAILHNPNDPSLPSNPKAIERFTKAAESLELGVELITKDDYAEIAEFDALFIRETTRVNHHTYRFARRAAAEGLVVVDDAESILKCTNKVYLAELLDHHDVPTPKTLIIHRDNMDQILAELGLPCVLKQPDSSFSQGVVKADDEASLKNEVDRFLDRSDLVIAQEFLPTTFDWRVGIFDRKPLYACKYFMAKKHWQIIKNDSSGERDYGKVETLPVELAPRKVVRMALKAAGLIGDGLYGVDIKQTNGKCYVIEVNDNPSIDAGFEDAVLKDDLYARIMTVFLRRIERRKEGKARW